MQHSGAIDLNVGIADRLAAARKRVLEATAQRVVDGVVVAPASDLAALPAPNERKPQERCGGAYDGLGGSVGDAQEE